MNAKHSRKISSNPNIAFKSNLGKSYVSGSPSQFNNSMLQLKTAGFARPSIFGGEVT